MKSVKKKYGRRKVRRPFFVTLEWTHNLSVSFVVTREMSLSTMTQGPSKLELPVWELWEKEQSLNQDQRHKNISKNFFFFFFTFYYFFVPIVQEPKDVNVSPSFHCHKIPKTLKNFIVNSKSFKFFSNLQIYLNSYRNTSNSANTLRKA